MTDAGKGRDASTADDDAPTVEKRRRGLRDTGATMRQVRGQIASVVWLIAVVCALFLAVGALLIALKANEDNAVVSFVLAGAQLLDGPFSIEEGVFEFTDENARVKNALVNWGLAAIVYLVIGKILDRVIRP